MEHRMSSQARRGQRQSLTRTSRGLKGPRRCERYRNLDSRAPGGPYCDRTCPTRDIERTPIHVARRPPGRTTRDRRAVWLPADRRPEGLSGRRADVSRLESHVRLAHGIRVSHRQVRAFPPRIRTDDRSARFDPTKGIKRNRLRNGLRRRGRLRDGGHKPSDVYSGPSKRCRKPPSGY